MAETKEAAKKYLEYEAGLDNPSGSTDPLLALAVEEEVEKNAPPQPEALALLRQLRRFSTLPNPGGLLQQPYIFMLELHACIDAEIEVQEQVVLNSRLSQWLKGE